MTILSGTLLAVLLIAASPLAEGTSDTPVDVETAASPVLHNGREYIVPELAEDPFAIKPGPRPFMKRLAFSPAYGNLGDDEYYLFRLAFNPDSWLGWEASVGHSPGETVHALLNTINAIVRYPLPWRLQPYGSAGYGMIMVFPGEALNADPVTKNVISYGGGLEAYVRNDVAIRFEMRGTTVFGGESDQGTVAYRYQEATVGFAFYRELK